MSIPENPIDDPSPEFPYLFLAIPALCGLSKADGRQMNK